MTRKKKQVRTWEMEAWFDFGHISFFLCRPYFTCGHGPVICSADVCLRQDTEPEGWTVTSGLCVCVWCVCVWEREREREREREERRERERERERRERERDARKQKTFDGAWLICRSVLPPTVWGYILAISFRQTKWEWPREAVSAKSFNLSKGYYADAISLQ